MLRLQSFFLTVLVASLCFPYVDGFQTHKLPSELSTAPNAALVLKHETTASKKPSGGESAKRKVDLPPVIQQIADERAEFQINLGRAMDTLRRDMPKILSRAPGKN